MKILRTIGELDAKVRECDQAFEISDDKVREVFTTFCMEPPGRLPNDPFSPEYRECQMALYREIVGKDYSLANEATVFEVLTGISRFFPYSTQSGVTAGEHLMAVGFLLRCMALPAGSRVLEFGFGWGNTTLALAALGHQVTAIDIEPRFCEVVRQRAAHDGLAIDILNTDFMWAEATDERFDAVIFFESFHHSDDHMRLLRALRRVVKPRGGLFFAGEPIQSNFAHPWGLRLDGQSLWSIRKHGWLELGFSSRYFSEALARTGWFGLRHDAGVPAWLNVWEARHRENVSFHYHGGHPALRTQIGERTDDAIVIRNSDEGTALFGPYLSLPAGSYVARIGFRPGAPLRGRATMDVCAGAGTCPLAKRVVEVPPLGEAQPLVELQFASEEDLTGVEVRLFCDQGFTADITEIEIRLASSTPPSGVTDDQPLR